MNSYENERFNPIIAEGVHGCVPMLRRLGFPVCFTGLQAVSNRLYQVVHVLKVLTTAAVYFVRASPERVANAKQGDNALNNG